MVRMPVDPGGPGYCTIDIVAAVVLILRVVVPFPPSGVTVSGEKVHEVSDGNPEHANATVALNPLDGETVKVVVSDDPATTVIDVGLAPTEKSLWARATAVAVRDTLCGLPLALSAMERDAVRVPSAVGVKVTLMMQ